MNYFSRLCQLSCLLLFALLLSFPCSLQAQETFTGDRIPILKVYDQDHLLNIALPLGGIGTGTVSLGGRGELRDWEIMNVPGKGYHTVVMGNDAPFFAIYTRDASGNVKLHDVGLFLRDRIKAYFREKAIELNLKYIDPSYMIRSLQANANDSVFCGFLGRDAVHAGMTGKTRMLVGHWNNHFVHVPMAVSARQRKQVNPKGKLWSTVLEATGQGSLRNPA